jgi:D-3-phosphoglycerate dehydrogenase
MTLMEESYRILITDKLGEIGLELLDSADDVSYEQKINLATETLMKEIGHYDALIVRSGTKVDKKLIKAGTRLKVIGRAGIGVDNVDVEAATERGILVMNTPQANSVATAEHTMALILAIGRQLPAAHASLLAGEWRRADFVGRQLYRKTLGIIGFGRIGRLVAGRALSFGMEVIAYDPFVSEKIARELGVILVDLDDLLENADFITLHTLLTTETRGIIDAANISKMKDGVVLINSARGALVDEQALEQALRSGKVKAAALDVFSNEPPINNPLIGMDNVIHTPHLAASTFEAQRDVASQIVAQVIDALRGTDFRNAINLPFAAGPDYKATLPHLNLAEKLGMIQVALAPSQIRRVEIEIRGDLADRLVRPVAAALLKGLLFDFLSDEVNYINAPVRAEEAGISIAQTKGIGATDYPNLIACLAKWDGGERLISGTLFGSVRPRIVQVDDYFVDVNPEGILLAMSNQDVPGVIGEAGTIFAENDVNIGEWRMGRHHPGGQALSVISLDNEPQQDVLDQLKAINGVTDVRLIHL